MPVQLARAQRTRRRRKSQPRTVLEELPSIDARWLARKKLSPKDWSTRRYSFDFQSPAVIRHLALGPRCAEVVLATGETQLIAIKWLRISGMCQSARPVFECVNCGRQRFKLFYYQGRFNCYRCTNRLGVPYASQTITPKARPILQAKRLRQFLGEFPGSTTIRKPLLMHRRTCSRLLAKLRHIEAKPHSRNYSSKRLNYRILRPVGMYRTQLAQFAE
jgi:hypothetical protein